MKQSPAEAAAVGRRLDLTADQRLDSLGHTPRVLLGLEAALARDADVLIFTTAGLDPSGRDAVYRAVTEALGRTAAIQLSYPLVGGQRDCLPNSTCVEAHREERVGVP